MENDTYTSATTRVRSIITAVLAHAWILEAAHVESAEDELSRARFGAVCKALAAYASPLDSVTKVQILALQRASEGLLGDDGEVVLFDNDGVLLPSRRARIEDMEMHEGFGFVPAKKIDQI